MADGRLFLEVDRAFHAADVFDVVSFDLLFL
jgi:hypothetical protein